MKTIVNSAIDVAQNCEIAFSKFITPNDTGATGGHQAGFHIHKNAWPLFFESAGVRGENKDCFATIKWQDDFETQSRFIYYGVGTRDEYRLTRFGKGFPFLQENNVGDLLIICKIEENYYKAFVLQTESDIEDFFVALNISSETTNAIIPRNFVISAEDKLLRCFNDFLTFVGSDFPTTISIATKARMCYNSAYNISPEAIRKNPDLELLHWLETEFKLFKLIENHKYAQRIINPFNSVEELIETANTILNRRKSRAGRSLEHHLSEAFSLFQISYSAQAVTEDNKKPDFIFPNINCYHDAGFPTNKLTMLACKTTCKDRWRQVLNEADRIPIKHLFTLQQGISKNQLEEMDKYGIQLVIPKPYLSSYPKEFRHKILTLEGFTQLLNSK